MSSGGSTVARYTDTPVLCDLYRPLLTLPYASSNATADMLGR